MAMNSDRLPLENKTEEHLADSLYLRNQRKSRLFLALLAVILLLSLVLSLWAGSYETPVAESYTWTWYDAQGNILRQEVTSD